MAITNTGRLCFYNILPLCNFHGVFQQTAEVNPQYFAKSADLLPHFLVEGHTFEVGGKSKKQKQIKDINDAFIVKDDIENSYLNILPLWTFGMNY